MTAFLNKNRCLIIQEKSKKKKLSGFNCGLFFMNRRKLGYGQLRNHYKGQQWIFFIPMATYPTGKNILLKKKKKKTANMHLEILYSFNKYQEIFS